MKNNKVLFAVFALALALTASGIRAFAQEGPCKSDMEKFCCAQG